MAVPSVSRAGTGGVAPPRPHSLGENLPQVGALANRRPNAQAPLDDPMGEQATNRRGLQPTVRYKFTTAGRSRPCRMRVEEPTEGGLLVEQDIDSSLVTTWTLTPTEGGERTLVSLASRWEGAGGIGGFFERMFAPRALRRIYDEVLKRLSEAVQG